MSPLVALRRDPLWLAELDLWNAAGERARLAYRADQSPAPRKVACTCGKRTEHASGRCVDCRRVELRR